MGNLTESCCKRRNPRPTAPDGRDSFVGRSLWAFYADPATEVGADTADPRIDDDDEIVFMSSDLGYHYDGSGRPPGTSASYVEVQVDDPLTGATGYLYLFADKGGAERPPPEGDHVGYRFALVDHPVLDYLQDYLPQGFWCDTYETDWLGCALDHPNREDSRIQTPWYAIEYQNRWLQHSLQLCDGDVCGADIIDYYNGGSVPGACHHSALTAAMGKGGMSVIRDGPVRAIRGEIGAQSAQALHRVSRFYARARHTTSLLRWHGNGTQSLVPDCDVSDPQSNFRSAVFIDCSSDVCCADCGCEYLSLRRACDAPDGDEGTIVLTSIDGQQGDVPVVGEPAVWELVSTPEGRLLSVDRLRVLGFEEAPGPVPMCGRTMFRDQETTGTGLVTCIGDSRLNGASGAMVPTCYGQGDPRHPEHRTPSAEAWEFYDTPSAAGAEYASGRAAEVDTPLVATTRFVSPAAVVRCGDGCDIVTAGFDCLYDCLAPGVEPGTCGDTVCDELETSTSCPGDCEAGEDTGYWECGNQQCEGYETALNCPVDCADTPVSTYECVEAVCEGPLHTCEVDSGCWQAVLCMGPCYDGTNWDACRDACGPGEEGSLLAFTALLACVQATFQDNCFTP